MSGVSPSPAEQHLGDRLAALVDGELNHDARERVLAHLATCAKCKAEADAQRRLKTLFVESAPPPLSAGLLARLQGLPGEGPDGASGPPGASGPSGPSAAGTFGYTAPAPPQQGFRIHEVGRPRRRFAFVAAGAVSLAAIALGGTLPLDLVEPNARGEAPASRPGSAVPAAPVSGTGPGPGLGSGPAVSVADAVIRDREPRTGITASPLPTAPLPPVHPSASATPRPVSLLR
ncbi:zf-HC2 domain-containing protein [Streptomyces sp. HUAS TT3]|uniref:zf-HC2 domain-containing protein n=1 Tax=Streptomyces sp. HUAS TT3 TaxID=3447510 RepID=UPI003F657D67